MAVDLTIIMPSWNKEKYIAQALDSILAQKTSYTYHILVADDHSTDHTLDIVDEYASRHPGLFTILRSDTNQKLFKNVRRAYALCKTPYFCVLDPDDYWTDPLKIQKALDWLEDHRDFTIYATDSSVCDLDGQSHPHFGYTEPDDSDFSDYLLFNAKLGCTQGSVFRNVVFSRGLPEKIAGDLRPDQEASFRGDSFRNLIHIHEGKAHFEPEITAVYRVTTEGLWQGCSRRKNRRHYCQMMADFNEYLDGTCPQLLRSLKLWERLHLWIRTIWR